MLPVPGGLLPVRKTQGGSRFSGGAPCVQGSQRLTVPRGCSRCAAIGDAPGVGEAAGARASAVPAAALSPSRCLVAPGTRRGGGAGQGERGHSRGERASGPPSVQRAALGAVPPTEAGQERSVATVGPAPTRRAHAGALPALPSLSPAAAFREPGQRGVAQYPQTHASLCPPHRTKPPLVVGPDFCPVGEVVFIPASLLLLGPPTRWLHIPLLPLPI